MYTVISPSGLWVWNPLDRKKFWKSCISGLRELTDLDRKEWEYTGCRIHYVTLNFDLTHDLDLRFWRSNLEISPSQEWEGQLTWNKRNKSIGCLTLKFDLTVTLTSGIEGSIGIERKGYESIGCWTHFGTLKNFDLTHNLDLRFSRSDFEIAVSEEWETHRHGT